MRLVSYALNTVCMLVNRRGESITKSVKMNSNLEVLNFVIPNRACVLPAPTKELKSQANSNTIHNAAIQWCLRSFAVM